MALALVAAVAGAYAPVAGAGFVNYDDPAYVSQNPRVLGGLRASGLAWALTTFETGNWHPLAWLSHQLDAELFGPRPGRHHLTSVALHALNACLVLAALWSLTGAFWRSALVAALFALHPLNVESVAWVAERKNVLSTTFWLLALLSHARAAASGRARPSLATAALMALGLLAKPMLVTLPLALLLLDHWPLGRLLRPGPGGGRVVDRGVLLEKVPLLLLAAASSVVTLLAQAREGAVASLEALPWTSRVANAVLAYATYLGKAALPRGLSVFYPHRGASAGAGELALAAAVLLGLSWLAWRQAGRRPWLLVGWLWYLGTLFPVIGLVQVGSQALADRYAYVPLLGVFWALAWTAGEVAGRGRVAGGATAAAALAALGALGVATHLQASRWSDSLTLFRHALAVTRDNDLAWLNLGQAQANEGRWAEAEQGFRQSLRVNRGNAEARSNLGAVLTQTGRLEEAERELRAALRQAPRSPSALNNLGVLLLRTGRPAEAAARFSEAVRAKAGFLDAELNLATALLDDGRRAEGQAVLERAVARDPGSAALRSRVGTILLQRRADREAAEQLRAAVALDPGDARARNGLAVALLRQGDTEGAVREARAALALDPGLADASANLGLALFRAGRTAEAEPALRRAIALKPGQADAHANLGSLLAQGGRVEEALVHFRAAVAAEPAHVVALNNLGAALLQGGDAEGALGPLGEAVRLSPRHVEALTNLGLALLRRGDSAGAREALQRALAAAPGHANAARALAQAEANLAREKAASPPAPVPPGGGPARPERP